MSTRNIHVRIKVHHSITLAFSQDPLEQQPGIISKHLVATPFPSAAAQLISMPRTCHIKYLHSLGVSPLLLWEKSRNHQSFIYLSFSLSRHRLTSHPWESKKNPACYFLASKCYTSLLDQVSPTQACITSPIWLLCHCMPLVFFLSPTAQTPQLKHMRTLNVTTILAQHGQSFSSWQVATQPIVTLARNLHYFLSLPLTSNSSARPVIMYQKYTWNPSTLFIFTASTLIPVIISYHR